ncbi:uncharacterized protein LTR77_010755 [Saxophila tyrrhenica]|uniref:Arabinogalactan endo-beta-1,4-galactanase n=1 Tax=Saxophila tyrrhenica TaxID=1690608 RepID=A0AAV9NY91_9PEZI|nr:hypothetical protein LTR77_010755 [Saxophila tyrrhenica]
MHLIAVFLALVAGSHAALTAKGVDWSSLLVEEASGQSYKSVSGEVQPLETILGNSGVNTVRQRLWYTDGDYGLEYNLELARRAQAAGLDFYLDIFYSPTWTDAGHQETPSDWANYGIDDLAFAVYNYTRDTMTAFNSAGIVPAQVAIGNEIRAGLLWPLGDMSNSDGPYNVARMLHSAAYGVRDSSSSTQVLVHLDNGWDYEAQQYFYDTVLAQGPLELEDFDVQAVSYYPFYSSSATLSALKTSLSSMKSRYNKGIQVVETDWPTYCPSPAYEFPADTTSIPLSTAGQTTWVQDIATVVEDIGGDGLFYWEPAWIDNAALGSSCGYNLMVDDDGTVMSSLAVFGEI